jgi:hypothetical protein
MQNHLQSLATQSGMMQLRSGMPCVSQAAQVGCGDAPCGQHATHRPVCPGAARTCLLHDRQWHAGLQAMLQHGSACIAPGARAAERVPSQQLQQLTEGHAKDTLSGY